MENYEKYKLEDKKKKAKKMGKLKYECRLRETIRRLETSEENYKKVKQKT